MRPIFITGIGTDVGKTVASAVVVQALQAHYWKPIQAGFEQGTDSETVKKLVTNSNSVFYPEVYKLVAATSPHWAAAQENIDIDIHKLVEQLPKPQQPLVIEGAGGLLVPVNSEEFVVDIIKALNARVILVSRNYLGSINHSLLTAQVCKQHGLDVIGWLFNDERYIDYEADICRWTQLPSLGTIPYSEELNQAFIHQTADQLRPQLLKMCLGNDEE
ncbi:MAG: dethiobiotin synthase [Bacteroidetes bacterium]|nr:MAG: dethiobiotin synthase [Bacteroidota bacterium]